MAVLLAGCASPAPSAKKEKDGFEEKGLLLTDWVPLGLTPEAFAAADKRLGREVRTGMPRQEFLRKMELNPIPGTEWTGRMTSGEGWCCCSGISVRVTTAFSLDPQRSQGTSSNIVFILALVTSRTSQSMHTSGDVGRLRRVRGNSMGVCWNRIPTDTLWSNVLPVKRDGFHGRQNPLPGKIP